MATSAAIAGKGSLLKRGDGGVGAGVQSYKNWGSSNTSIRISVKVPGAAGNGKSITVVSSGASFVKTTLTANAISITVPTTATVAQVIAWLYSDDTFAANWEADYNSVGDGSGVCPAQTVTTTAGGSDGTEVFTTVSEIQGISYSGMTQQYADVTHQESPDGFREEIPTLKDPGTITFGLSYVPTDAQQKGLIDDHVDNVLRNFKVVLPDGTSTWVFAAYISTFSFDAPHDGKLGASVTLKIKGAITPPA